MCDKNLVHGLKAIKKPDTLCKGCLEGKQTRNPYPTHTLYKEKEKLKLIHADICGPISPEIPAGNRYFFLFVDDFSHVMWVYMLKSKDEALDMFHKFRVLVENETGVKVKTLRTDCGGEFNSKGFIEYCDETGLKHHFTAPYSPQQNGVVERRNRSVFEMARSMMKSMEVPDTLWGEAVRQAVYIQNRVPTKTLGDTTPYERWSGKKPNLEHLRVKAYRLLDPVSGRIRVSRDVRFEEVITLHIIYANGVDPLALPLSTIFLNFAANERNKEKGSPSPDTTTKQTHTPVPKRDALLRQLKQNLIVSKHRMEMQANKSRHEVEFNSGDMVLVELQPYRQVKLAKRHSNNLAKRYYWPFEVLEPVGKVAYQLALPDLSKIHLEATWEWLLEFKSAYPSYHFDDKVIFEGDGNDTPMPKEDPRPKRATSKPVWHKDYVI
ncbi:putative RNA-directed DNA polymerase [Tanacetum coccineum]